MQTCSTRTQATHSCQLLSLWCLDSPCSVLQAQPECFDDKQRSETDFFEYVAKSYKYFLAGDDYQCQVVDEEKAQEFEQRAAAIRDQNMQLLQVTNQHLVVNNLLVSLGAMCFLMYRSDPQCVRKVADVGADALATRPYSCTRW